MDGYKKKLHGRMEMKIGEACAQRGIHKRQSCEKGRMRKGPAHCSVSR